MDLERYETEQISEFGCRFFSEGPRGRFKMHVSFTHLGPNAYNLGFGMVDREGGQLNDLIQLKNGDRDKILATVAHAALEFLDVHPYAQIYVSGSTGARTRLYQMGINRIIHTLTDYVIAGFIAERDDQGNIIGYFPSWGGRWSSIHTGISYDAFLIFKSLKVILY